MPWRRSYNIGKYYSKLPTTDGWFNTRTGLGDYSIQYDIPTSKMRTEMTIKGDNLNPAVNLSKSPLS